MNTEYISKQKLIGDIKTCTSFMQLIHAIAEQPSVDVIPEWFIREYLAEQERGSAYQNAIYALLGAWNIEKEKRFEEGR